MPPRTRCRPVLVLIKDIEQPLPFENGRSSRGSLGFFIDRSGRLC
jgi:hypothetical protein